MAAKLCQTRTSRDGELPGAGRTKDSFSGLVHITREIISFSATFILIAAMNPCPCGWNGDAEKTCTCSPAVVARYQKRISGPLLDPIDIHVDVAYQWSAAGYCLKRMSRWSGLNRRPAVYEITRLSRWR